jgi:starvation-inducible DNA-binding protein
MKTNYGLPDKAIDTLSDHLAKLLANTYALYIKTQYCHWNMEGANFIALHKLLEDQYGQLAEAVDELAERIRMMGRYAPGSLAQLSKLATVKELESPPSQDEMVALLAADHEAAADQLRRVIGESDELGDPGTSDLLTDLLRDHEKSTWFLRSHL